MDRTLRFSDGVVLWDYWDINQNIITEIFIRYNLNECMGISAPFTKNRYNCETFLKVSEKYLSHADLERTLLEWVNASAEKDGAGGDV